MDTKIVIKNTVLEAHVLLYGATLQKLIYKDTNVVLGYETEAEYRKNGGYLGATVGRYANRIAGGRFEIDRREYNVGCNEKGRGHIHGGVVGMDKRIFTPVEVRHDSVKLALRLTDGEEGYPGNMNVTVTYSLRGSALCIAYDADSDADTVFNPTNHSYFNLSGGGTILDHELMIEADEFIPVDEKLIPFGKPECVEGTPFDFRKSKSVGRDIISSHPQLEICGGYDHTFVLSGKARLFSPVTGISMSCTTDMPGIQIYSGNFLQETGGYYGRNSGIAMETGFCPDTPNHPAFPQCTLRGGSTFRSVTEYRFGE